MSLEKLREITKELPPLLSTVGNSKQGGYIQYETEKGMAFGFCLHKDISKDSSVAVQKFFMSKGAEFPAHFHSGYEWGLVVKGAIEIFVDGKGTIFRRGDMIDCPINTSHSSKAHEDTIVIFMQLPANIDNGYPDAE